MSREFRAIRFLQGVHCAVMYGQLDILKWWQNDYLPDRPDVLELLVRVAALHRRLNVLKWLLEGDETLQIVCDMEPLLVCQHRRIVDWIHSRNPSVLLEVTANNAVKRGDLEFINWVERSSREGNVLRFRLRPECMDDAVVGGHLNVLQWAHESDPMMSYDKEMDLAATNGHLHILKWLSSTRCQCIHQFDQPGTRAAFNGHLDVVKWMVEEYGFKNWAAREEWIANAMEDEISSGKWPVNLGFKNFRDKKFMKRGLHGAIKRGDLKMVKWLATSGFASSQDPMAVAAKHGRLRIFQWLYGKFHDDKAGTTTDVMDFAAGNNHMGTVLWLHANRTEGCTVEAMVMAARKGHLQMVQWLHENRKEFHPTDYIYSKNDRFHSICQLGGYLARAMDCVAANGHLDVVRWLREYRYGGCTQLAMDKAAENGHLHVVRWLYNYRSNYVITWPLLAACCRPHSEHPSLLFDTLFDESVSKLQV